MMKSYIIDGNGDVKLKSTNKVMKSTCDDFCYAII